MATSSKRVLWKGAITFGLVHIPIALHSATSEQGLDFDWLDKRSMDPVGYKRINKATGKEISAENIVKGIEYEDGQYVILTPEEIEAAYPKTTQTIEIEAFVAAGEIPFVYLERPYYTSPINKGTKVYAMLREVLKKTGKVGIAKVVIQTKQHLAVLIPTGPALVLNLIRWGDEIRTWEELSLPPEGAKAAGLTEKEMKMAEQLVDDLSSTWKPEDFTDSFKEQIMKLVGDKVKAGKTESVSQPDASEKETTGAQIYDLTELLQRSLKGKTAAGKNKNEEADEDAESDSVTAPKPKPATKKVKSSSKPGAKTTVRAPARTASAKPAPSKRKSA